MAKPSTRQGLIDYCKRQLGAPVLEINVDDDQIDDLVDDAIQFFNERHYDGVQRAYLKYKISENDIKRGRARGNKETLGITTSSTGTSNVTTTGDSYWNSVILRSTFDEDFTDFALGATPTASNSVVVKVVGSPTKVGSKSLSVDGRLSDFLEYPYKSQYNFTGAWTFESWLYVDTSPTAGAIWSVGSINHNTNIFGLLIDNQDSKINFRWSNTDNSSHASTFGTKIGEYESDDIVREWVHIALVRESSDGSIHFYLNGTESSLTSSSQIIDNDIAINSSRNLYLGARRHSSQFRYGDIALDDLRISTISRYTSNFTAPSTQLPISGLVTISTGGEVSNFEENSNYLTLPDAVIGVEKLYHFDSSFVSNNMFSFKYQLFLNDVAFNLGYNGILDYVMTKTYIQDLDYLLTTNKQIRYNKQNNRLYLDLDWSRVEKDEYIIIDCFRAMDPAEFSKIYNDSFVKRYLTALIKRQWGANMIKFSGTKLPGGIELNGRQYYEDGQRELDELRSRMAMEYELPPLDFIG